MQIKVSGQFDIFSAKLKNFGALNFQDHRAIDKLREALLNNIASKKPFSLIRLGDGEGNVLFWGSEKENYPDLANICMKKIWQIMFGNTAVDNEIYSSLYSGIALAIRNASYLGIPTYQQTSQACERLINAKLENFDLRGNLGVIGVWNWIEREEFVSRKDLGITAWHVHNHLMNFYGDLIQGANNISVITCYPNLLDLLKEKFSVKLGRAYLIPPQAVNISRTPSEIHYPLRFNKLIDELSSESLAGKLFFVGAGLPGKIYCDQIKRQGGMALDIGSIMDVWVGKGVRPYQDLTYVRNHQIINE